MDKSIIQILDSNDFSIETQTMGNKVLQESSVTATPNFDSSSEKNFVEALVSELFGLRFDTEFAAYECYRRYAFVTCFGVRYGNLRKNNKGEVIGRELCCCKEGSKAKKGTLGKHFAKLDRRTGCKAMVYFKIIEGRYECVRHDMTHNHEFCHPNEVHHLRCHRNIDDKEVQYLLHLRASGIRLCDGVRALMKEAGGSSVVGFEYTDAITAVNIASKKKFDRTDCNTLINILKQRATNEEDFYYDFELDEDNCLVSLYFRDKMMRQDYESFSEVLGNDGTYCTNRYDMVCAPLVGINHHTRICMFGIGFMVKERTESYEWLYTTFLKSMGGIQPRTIMTDQSKAMETAIKTCFPKSKHRLCVWHLFKNAATHLGKLKDMPGFNKLFGRILKKCHTEGELEHFWNKMVTDYNCGDHLWLIRLYELRDKWCCAFGKDYFSAGVLSSQRSESTNNSLWRHLSKTTTLCDFYEIFGSVVSEWRSHETKDNEISWDGKPEFAVKCDILEKAAEKYTIGAFKRMEKEFMEGMTYKQELMSLLDQTHCYHVYTHRKVEWGHTVTFDTSSHFASCTCKRFEEGGFLCRHIFRIYHIMGVDEIPSVYIIKRWTKNAKPKEDVIEGSKEKLTKPVWRLDMRRRFNKLIIASADNESTRDIMNDCFEKARVDIEVILGGIHLSDNEDDDGNADVVQNPKGRSKKGERFKRKRSLIDIQTSRARGRIKAAETRARKKKVADSHKDKERVEGLSINVCRFGGHMGLREIIMTPEEYDI